VNFFQPSFKLKEKRREGAKVIKRYHEPSTPYERALAHPMVAEAVKERLRAQYRTLDPVALLAEIRSAQEALGNRIDRRAGAALPTTAAGKHDVIVHSATAEAAAFARRLGNALARGEPRATHPAAQAALQKTDSDAVKARPHVALIESWLAAEPQLTAIAIVGRLAELHPGQFGKKQHSIVQRLLRALRKSAAQKLIAETVADGNESAGRLLGAMDGSGCGVAPIPVRALNADSTNVVVQLAR
jgi:hypothetical protein